MFFDQKSLLCKFLTVLLIIRRKKKKNKIRHTRRHKLQLNQEDDYILPDGVALRL